MLHKYNNEANPGRTIYVGNMLDILGIVRDTKQAMLAQYGPVRGPLEFAKLRAKDVLGQYAVPANLH